MSAEALEAEQHKFRRYHTETGPVSTSAATTPGVSGLAAADLRKQPAFLQEVAAKVFLMLGELARHRRLLDKALVQPPAPLPRDELGALRHQVAELAAELREVRVDHAARLVSLEYGRTEALRGPSPGLVLGLSAAAAVVCVASALVCVAVAVLF